MLRHVLGTCVRLRSWITGSEHIHSGRFVVGCSREQKQDPGGFLVFFLYIVFAISAVSFAEDKANGG